MRVVLLLTLLSYLVGSLPFSIWVGKLALKTDIRRFGDANPGATNVFRAGGRWAGILALLLDFIKGAIPVSFAHFQVGLTGWALIAVALAPILGHAFSPFLGFRGGKAVAVTGGIWCGLTVWEGPTIGGILLGLGTWLFGANGRAVLFSQIGMSFWLLLTPPSWNLLNARPTLFEIVGVTMGALLLLMWKHRGDFASA